MPTFTSRVGLRKPDTSDNVIVGTDINDNFDDVDKHLGLLVCTSASRPTGSDRFIGRTIYETDTHSRLYWNGTAWILIGKRYARKTANEVVNNSATLQNDDALAVVLGPGTWEVQTHLVAGGPTGADLKVDYTFSGTLSTHRRYLQGPAGTGNDSANTILTLGAQTAITAAAAYALEPVVAAHIWETIIAVVTAGGTLQLRWAQNVATASDTTIFTNAYMTAEQIDE